MLSDWVIETFAGEAKAKLGVFFVPVEEDSSLCKVSQEDHHIVEGLKEA